MNSRFLLVAALSLSASARGWCTPILSEVFYDAVGPDATEVFTELTGCPGASLDAWSLVGVNGGTGLPYRTIDLTGVVVPSDGILVIATAQANAALAAVADFIANVDWQNGPDAVELWNPLGIRVDALQYGETGGPPLGEGRPAPDVAPGFSLARLAGTIDTGDNRNDFRAATPSPGTVPTVDVAEPGTFSLLLSFLVGLPALTARARRGSRPS